MKPGNRFAKANSGANSRGGGIRRKMRRMGIFRVRLVFRAARFLRPGKEGGSSHIGAFRPTEERKIHLCVPCLPPNP